MAAKTWGSPFPCQLRSAKHKCSVLRPGSKCPEVMSRSPFIVNVMSQFRGCKNVLHWMVGRPLIGQGQPSNRSHQFIQIDRSNQWAILARNSWYPFRLWSGYYRISTQQLTSNEAVSSLHDIYEPSPEHTPPSHRVTHRNFMFGMNMSLCPKKMQSNI